MGRDELFKNHANESIMYRRNDSATLKPDRIISIAHNWNLIKGAWQQKRGKYGNICRSKQVGKMCK